MSNFHTSSGNNTMHRPVSIIASLLVILLVAGSCSATDRGGDRRHGDQHLRLAGSTFGLQTIDPAMVRDVESAFVARQVFRGLMRLDETLTPVPELAETVEVSADGLVYTFRLHEDLTFHAGNRIDADAVVRSFNRAADPDLASGAGQDLTAATYFSDIVGIENRLNGSAGTISGISALDALTVEFTLSRPVATFLMKLTGSPAAIIDTQQATGDGWWHEANGSGPFAIESYNAGESLVLEAFDDFVGGTPELRRVTLLLGSSAMQPMNLYEAGTIDVANVPGWAIDRIETSSDPLNSHLVRLEQLSTTYIAFSFDNDMYDDLEVRRAMAAGFDLDLMIELGYAGRVARASGMVPPGILATRWEADTIDFDLSAAQSSLDQADPGVDELEIVEPGAGVSSTLHAVLGRDLGLNVIAIDQPWPEFASRLPNRDLPAFVLTWVADFPDPENMLATLLRTGSPDNYSGYSNPEFDDLVDRALVEDDEQARIDLYLQAQQLVIDDVAVIPLYHGMSYTLVQPWVRGLEITEIGILGLENIWIESDSS
jgi:oligopeptide transport system substrate-binding protein